MLTKRQKQILDYIKKFIKDNDYAPTIEEIKRHFRLSSLATIHKHIENLRIKGELRKVENQPRSIQLNHSNKKSGLIEIPLLGTIAAGAPIEAIEFPETVSVPKSQLSKTGEHFALRVQGDSMLGEGIFDRDIVVIRKQPDAENGETVVALINNDEVTLKKIYKEKNRFRLQPANPNIKPIFVKELVVQGKVINVIRNYEKAKEAKIKNNNSEFAAATTNYINQTDINYRKSLGQYFTPKSIREMLLEKLPKMENPKILDPACGTGEFLVTAKKYFNNPELYGWDIDKNLVNISKNLIPEANLNKTDSLLNEDYDKYDFVIGNPPYYEFKAPEKIRRKFGSIMNGRTNIFSLFVYQGLNWLKDGGYLAYVIPPSMNNGAYFYKLRNYIIHNANIEYLHVLRDPKIFHGALQSIMLLVLKKGKNKGNYLFKKNGILIFSEGAKYLQRIFKDKATLHDLNYQVRTGRLVWNENKNLLTDNPKKGIPLIWAHNITEEGLDFPVVNGKPQYVKRKDFDVGPAIVVNRITGTVKESKLKAGFIPSGMKFIAENHVNVIFPPSEQEQIKMDFGNNQPKKNLPIRNIIRQLSSMRGLKVIKNITGNTQISKNELEKLFPISLNC